MNCCNYHDYNDHCHNSCNCGCDCKCYCKPEPQKLVREKGTIIPYSSGKPVVLTTLAGGAVGFPAVIAFGDHFPLLTVLDHTIDLTGLVDMTFTMPRNGILRSLSVFFSTAIAINISSGSAKIHAVLYEACPAGNKLKRLESTHLELKPSLHGLINIGDKAFGRKDLCIPVKAGARLALVVYVDATCEIATTVTGTVSGGLEIL